MLIRCGQPALGVQAQARGRKAVAGALAWRSRAVALPHSVGAAPVHGLLPSSGRDVRCNDTPPQSTVSPTVQTAAPAAVGTIVWDVTLKTSKVKFGKKRTLSLQLINEDGTTSELVTLSSKAGWKETEWKRSGPELNGTIHTGQLSLPDTVMPAVVVLEQTVENPAKDHTYLYSIELSAHAQATITFPADTYLYAGKRVIFDGKGRLPSQTPPALRALREQELKDLQGVDNPAAEAQRKGGDRIYDYQTYNDLGSDKELRPALGGSAEFPYPRRIRTGRPLYPGLDAETPATPSGTNAVSSLTAVPWMPPDDDFDADKAVGFLGNSITAFLPALQLLFNREESFKSIKEVLKLFDDDDNQLGPIIAPTPAAGTPIGALIDSIYRTFRGISLRLQRAQLYFVRAQNGNANVGEVVGDFFKNVVAQNDDVDDFFSYPVPRNLADRVLAWDTDEEFGRQYLAGQNPLALTVLRQLPQSTSITAQDLAAHVEGQDVAALLALERPRLFIVDFHTVFAEYADMVNNKYLFKDRVQHAGHAVLYRRNDGHLVPIAIDLTTGTATKPTVFTPASTGALWLIAKAVFASLDSSHHQLISHFVRTHAAVEPYLIATRRHLSTWHPVFDLIMPHFRYTMPINANARGSLIQAGGVIEENFTPKEFAMRMSSTVYGKVWRFDREALPADLAARGLLRERVDADGKVTREVLLDDYPYAEDGLLVWEAIEQYFTEYINLYYETDADVETDNEIQAWWTEIKTVGHGDKKEGWLDLNTRSDLVRILATIAWVGSGHHAAVNFGQYDYSAFMPGRSSLIRRAMPSLNDGLYQALSQVTDHAEKEAALLTYVGNPASATKVTTTVKLLSSHAEDEQYLSDPNQQYLVDLDAKAAHGRFVKRILETEAIIEQRNAQPSAQQVSRDVKKRGLPYRFLLASSKESGVSGRGVPYSISI